MFTTCDSNTERRGHLTGSGKRFTGLSSFEILAMFRRGMFYAYLTIYLRHYLGLSVTGTTLFATLPMLVNVFSQTFVWGTVSDRLQLRRTLIMVGEIMGAIGTMAVWYFHRLPHNLIISGYIIILGLSFVEFFWSMSNISWSALISDLYKEVDRSRIQGRLTSMGGMGRIAGVWVGGLLYDGWHKNSPGWGFYHGDLFFVAAGVMLISVLPLLLLPEGGFEPTKKESKDPFPKALSPVAPRSDRFFIIFLFGVLLINFGRNAIAIIFPQYLTLTSGLDVGSRTLSYILNTQSAAIVGVGWIAGWLCRKSGTVTTLLAAGMSAFLAMIILATCTTMPMIYLASFLRGVADAAILASAYELASVLIPPDRRARRFAWFNATFFLSWGLPATLVVGPLVDTLISTGYPQSRAYQASFFVAAAMVLMGVAMEFVLFNILKPGARPVVHGMPD